MTENTPDRPQTDATPEPTPEPTSDPTAPTAPASVPAPAPAPQAEAIPTPAPAPTPTATAVPQAAYPTAPPPAYAGPPYPAAPYPPVHVAPAPRGSRKGAFVALGVVAALLVGGGTAWWVLGGDGDAMSHVEVSGGKLTDSENSLLDEGEECDDSDEYTYNDCDATTAYEFVYKITNKGDEPANYAVIVNGFDEDGDFVGQAYFSATHLRPGRTDADTGEFDEYVELEDDHTLADIETIKVAHVERVALAN
ncbi:flagellar basal body-associated FliL family protein [Streptomyces antibioticus]|uniref:hypothetical protein n=1 Tax=Streptomyces antibioticus TaxID=1890 RepID=UPI00225A4235|nr:hypothetical protein [Streptomyces antibioticus]MCX4742046.1 hypothetical protein [Streptomyces antibioticus]